MLGEQYLEIIAFWILKTDSIEFAHYATSCGNGLHEKTLVSYVLLAIVSQSIYFY